MEHIDKLLAYASEKGPYCYILYQIYFISNNLFIWTLEYLFDLIKSMKWSIYVYLINKWWCLPLYKSSFVHSASLPARATKQIYFI